MYEYIYFFLLRGKISLLFESCDYELEEMKKIPNLSFKQIKLPNPFSHHHRLVTKLIFSF